MYGYIVGVGEGEEKQISIVWGLRDMAFRGKLIGYGTEVIGFLSKLFDQ